MSGHLRNHLEVLRSKELGAWIKNESKNWVYDSDRLRNKLNHFRYDLIRDCTKNKSEFVDLLYEPYEKILKDHEYEIPWLRMLCKINKICIENNLAEIFPHEHQFGEMSNE